MKRATEHDWAWHEARLVEDAARLANRKRGCEMRMLSHDQLPRGGRRISHIVGPNELVAPLFEVSGGDPILAERILLDHAEELFGPVCVSPRSRA